MLALTERDRSVDPMSQTVALLRAALARGLRAVRAAGFAGTAISLLASQVLTMAVVNFFELPGWVAGLLVPIAAALILVWIARSDLRLTRLPTSRHLLAVAMAVLLSLPRLPYILEPAIGFAANAVVSDDWWHFQEIAAIAYTPSFPAVSSFSSDHLLGFYYAAWLLPAALFKVSHGLLTVASAYGISVAFYNVVFTYWVVYAAALLFKAHKEQSVFVFVCFAFSGFASVSALLHPATLLTFPSNAESWPGLLGFNVQFSSFATLALWTPHHLVACLAALTAGWVLLRDTRNPIGSALLAGALLAFAAFASIFATIGAAPILLCMLVARRLWRRAALTTLACGGLCAPLAWIYLGHSSGAAGFALFGALSPDRLQNPEVALFVFVLMITAQFGVLLAAAWRASVGRTVSRSVATSALLYLGSTFVISFVGFNNYAARGSTAAVLALAWVATPRLASWWDAHRGWAIVVAASYLMGSALSLGSVFSTSIAAVRASDTAFNRAVLAQNLARKGFGTPVSAELPNDLRWYLVENHRNDSKRVLLAQDTEIMTNETPWRFVAPWLGR